MMKHNILLIIEKDVRQFFKYRWWMAGLISMNLADIFILAIVFSNMVTRLDYFRFVLPGIVVMALFASAFTIGREVSIEIRRQFHHYILSLPFRDWEVVLGRMTAGGIRGLIYSSPLLILAIILSPIPNPLYLLAIPPILLLLSLGIGALAIFMATVIKNFDAYITARGLLYFLLIFCSTVFYPLEIFKALPWPVYVFAKINPVSHGADIMRDILQNGSINITNLLPLTFFSLLFAIIGSVLYALAIRK